MPARPCCRAPTPSASSNRACPRPPAPCLTARNGRLALSSREAITKFVAAQGAGRTSMLSRSLHRSVRRALDIASEQQSDHAAPDHLLIALTEDADALSVMRACDVNIEKLRRSIFASLPIGNHDAKLERVRPDASFRTIMRRAVKHIRSVERDEITGAHVLVQMFGDPAARFLQEQGLTSYDAAFYVCHGVASRSAAAKSATAGAISRAQRRTGEGRYQVVLLNDLYTPMWFVVRVLEEIFLVTRDGAIAIMLSTHEHGTGLCGTWNRIEAQSLAERVMERAREFQHPLRCVTVPCRGGPAREVISSWLRRLNQRAWDAFDQRAR
jgi:ATP-dependent Clp protease adapter protein ClpS